MRHGRVRTYAGVLDIPEATSGPVTIAHRCFPEGFVMQSGNFRTAMFGQKAELLKFEAPTRWHELSEKGHGVWMTDFPIEQRQTDELIRHATGRVLVGGLGLGYAVVALAAKKRVKEIVVVERSKHITKLVWPWTVQRAVQHNPAIKLTLVTNDLFTWLEHTDQQFDWGLFDIWQADGETTFHETVVPLRALAHGKVRKLECWNEDIMRGQLHQGLATKLHLIRHPLGPEFAAVQPTASLQGGAELLALLCEPNGSMYIDWAVPFWRWYRECATRFVGAGGQDTLSWVMGCYAKTYGRPEANNGLDILDRMDRLTRKKRIA